MWGPFASNQNGCLATNTPGSHRKRVPRGFWEVGNSNPVSVSCGRQWLLGNRYTRISPKRASQRVFRGGELESAVNSIGVWGVDRQLTEIEFAGNNFYWGISMEKTWIWVQLIERVMVDDPAYISSWNKDRSKISRESKRNGDLIWSPTFFSVTGSRDRSDLSMGFRSNIWGLSCPEESKRLSVDGKPMEIEFTGKPPLIFSIGWIIEVSYLLYFSCTWSGGVNTNIDKTSRWYRRGQSLCS